MLRNMTWDKLLGNEVDALETLTLLGCTTKSTVEDVLAAIVKHINTVGEEETGINLSECSIVGEYDEDIKAAYHRVGRQLLIDAQTIEQKKEATT